MAPRTKAPLKNYTRNTCGNRSKLDILHNILTDPIKKKPRRKPKLEIKELPPRSQQICDANSPDSFITANIKKNNDDTFDRLLNKTNYNKVTFKVIVQNNSSDSSLSTLQKSKCSPLQLQITKKCSPVKRKRIRSVKNRSPIVTRSVSFENSIKNEEDKKVHTLDRTVDESLFIENERFGAAKESSLNISFEPIFSKTFMEKYNNLNVPVSEASAISSTPVMPVLKQRLLNETVISPIVNFENESNMTPKLKRVSKVRKSKLIKINREDINCDISEGTSVNPERQIALKNKSKLLRNAIVNVTLLNSKNLKLPFINLTNIDLNLITETNIRNVITELNRSKISIVNITTTNYDKSDIIDDDLDLRLRSPIVNVTRIDLNSFLNQKSICNESMSGYGNENESNRESSINDLSDCGFRGFPPCDSVTQDKDEISTDFEGIHSNLTNEDDNLQIYLTLRCRKVPRSKCVSKSKSDSKQGSSSIFNSINESVNQTNLSVRSASIIEENLLIDKENASPKSYITLRTRRVHKSTPKVYRSNKSKSKSRIILDTTTQTDTNLKCDISPDLFESYNSSNATSLKDIPDVIFSSDNNKRSRNSQFKQSINSSKIGAIYCDNNTPIKITKRSRMYTPKKNYKIVDSLRKTSTPKFITIQNYNSPNNATPLKDTSSIIIAENTPIKLALNKDYKMVDLLRRTSTPKFATIPSCNSSNSGFLNPTTPLKDTSNITDNMADAKTVDSTTKATEYSETLYTPNKNAVIIDLVNTTPEKLRKSQQSSEYQPQKINETKEVVFAVPKLPLPKKRQDSIQEDKIVLKPGKLWRRSLLEVRNSKSGASPARQSLICVADKAGNSCTCVRCKQNFIDQLNLKRLSVRVVPLSDVDRKQSTVLEDYAISCKKSFLQLQSSLNDSLQNSTLCKDDSIVFIEQETQIVQSITVTAREIVLSKCGQEEPLSFAKLYPNSMLQNCQKIGEGVYGEVFLVRRPASKDISVMKIIPIEGSLTVNGEHQKTFQEILSEITIAMELSRLRTNTKNCTDCFNELKRVACVRGKYPKRLVELWELYDENRGSENDHPKMFNKDQLYIVLELANGGDDMEKFVFENAQQAYSIIMQITLALAVAESEIEFEHRDLHWGNVLISSTTEDNIRFSLNGEDISLKSYGVHVAIIDYTLSRMSQDNVCLYNDLAMDPDLFTATGDYQFEVYRLMQKQNCNDWQHFEPYTNVLWLHYLLNKSICSLRYRKKTTKLHKQYLADLRKLHKDVLNYDSAKMFAVDKFVI